MALFGNTFFWTFFFMLGFVASVELIQDLGSQMAERWLHRPLDASWLLIGYVLIVLVCVRLLRVFADMDVWTANVLRNGALLYISTKLTDRRAFRALLGATALSFWPFWDWHWAVLAWFVGVLALLDGVNRARRWLLGREWRLLTAVAGMSLVMWGFDAYAYHTPLNETLLMATCFFLIQCVARGYDRLLVYRKHRIQTLQYDTQHDSLTGAMSRAKFMNDLSRWRQLRVSGQVPPVYLAMMDLDHFKAVNDEYGHLAGDALLRAFTRNWRDYIDAVAYPCSLYRTGGEEFSLIIAGGADAPTAQRLLTDYLAQLATVRAATRHGALPLTVSIGLTAIRASDARNEILIDRADAHLYAAKRAGRARLVTDDQEEGE
ncbi:GGDEF domain-containing protein [Lacticaseibacillus absianus]|uniref:GGDEF domain-containing protein n=1 Tax=Lacticaseibacillus absianus TaxID=2729623 RepID=UPI0015C746B6|nr:GGDEF domain-containing protein [Lacticaseibacillus absianus]